MNLLPTIYGTRCNYPFQGTMADTSGNGFNLSTLNAFTSVPGGTEQYGTLGCLQAFLFDGGTKMIAPFSAALQNVGSWTNQWLMYQPVTIGGPQTWFCLVDPAGRSGGGAPDRIGSIYTFFWSVGAPGGHPFWADMTHGSNLPVPGGAWWTTIDTGWGAAIHAVAVRYAINTPTAGLVTIDLFIDGVKQTPNVQPMSTTEAVTGVERFYVGGSEASAFAPANTSLMAGFRSVSYARTDAQVIADQAFQINATCNLTPTYPVIDAPAAPPLVTAGGGVGLIGPAVTAEMYRYSPKAYGDRFSNPGDDA